MRVYTATVLRGISDQDSIRVSKPDVANEIPQDPYVDPSEPAQTDPTMTSWSHAGDLTQVAARYDVGTMTGTDVIHFANDLIATGIDQTDALAVTWPINCRNLLHKIGKVAAAPKVESWDDVVRLYRARRDLAERRFLHDHREQLERLISLAESLHLATSDYDLSGPGH
tara:strand:- start:23565 stop:24071 length:507 start_codon:yes stop_codon:yes gene_type:complete